ncbi:MAG: carboxypeptidase regulatory-like domain-containing protein [Bryobacteraceae bacterium]
MRTAVQALCLGIAAFFSLSQAQDYRARVQGAITDSTQAAVPGARVVLANTQTGVETVKLSNEAGRYLFDFVEPGAYNLIVEAAGFGKFVQQNILVQVRGDVTVDAHLTVGSVSETVTVSERAVSLQFNTATMDMTIDRRMLDDLPAQQRNPFSLALLDPATVNKYTATRYPFYMWSSSRIDVGGGTDMKNDLQLDGAPLQIGQKGSYSPPMDAVQEFTVQQNAVDAEFGHSDGGVLSVGMKSGTNEFHGTAYYFGRNPALNAVSSAVTRAPNVNRNHIWGGTLGNPIRRNRLFTFTAYEAWKNKDPLNRLYTLPTEAERAGDFSRSLNVYGNLRAIYDPYTTKLDAAGKVTRMPFAGNRIPANRMDPTALRILKDIWLPNGSGDDAAHSNNFKIGYSSDINYWNFSNRTDWNIHDNWKTFVRYSTFRTQVGEQNYTPNHSRAQTNGSAAAMNSLNVAADTVYTLNPTTVLSGRWSYGYLNDDYHAPDSIIGETGLAEFWPNNPWYKPYIKDIPAIYYPALIFPGNTPNSTTNSPTFGKANYFWQHPATHNASAKISKDHGRHYIKGGADLRFLRGDAIRPNLMYFNLQPAHTADTYVTPNTRVSGDAWATFLLGVIGSDSQAQYIPRQNPQFNFYGGFVNDDLKLSRRLTVTLGLRWEYQSGPRDPQDRLSRYLDLTNPIPEMQTAPPKMPADVAAWRGKPYVFNGAWVFTDSEHRSMFQASKTNFMPRLGMAFRVNDKTALRAGFARYMVLPEMMVDTLGSLAYPGFDAATTVVAPLQGVPQATLSNPFPATNPLILPVGKGYGRYTNLGGNAAWNQYELRPAVSDRFNISVQRELRGHVVADVTYFLNMGHDLPYTWNVNMADPEIGYQYKTLLTQTVANPFYRYSTPDKFPGQLRNQQNVAKGSLLGPYPQYLSVQQNNTNGILDRYHSLQVKVQRAFSGGFMFMTAYNYARQKGYNFFNDDDTYARRFTWLNSNLPRHRLSAAGTYHLPFGKGRPLLNRAHPVVNAILGGWSTSSMLALNSGNFLRFGGAIVNGNPIIDNPTRERWFDTSVFTRLPAYTRRTNPNQYEGLTGPRNWNVDTTLAKFFNFSERKRLEFRIEAYNLTNSFIPSNPDVNIVSATFGRCNNQANRGRELQYTVRVHF